MTFPISKKRLRGNDLVPRVLCKLAILGTRLKEKPCVGVYHLRQKFIARLYVHFLKKIKEIVIN